MKTRKEFVPILWLVFALGFSVPITFGPTLATWLIATFIGAASLAVVIWLTIKPEKNKKNNNL